MLEAQNNCKVSFECNSSNGKEGILAALHLSFIWTSANGHFIWYPDISLFLYIWLVYIKEDTMQFLWTLLLNICKSLFGTWQWFWTVCMAKMCICFCTEVKLVNLPHLFKAFHLSSIFLNYISELYIKFKM